jgi:hypothetical protein
MIELTPDQVRALAQAREQPLTLIDPATQATYVVLRKEEYERLLEEYDTTPWTAEEMDLLAAEDADRLGWEGMDVYQDDQP